ncbi:MAG TPA: hypothetical protein VFC09_15295 [Candidatus Dormibacteraeota bacterium]|nr:hypothetical protein [Candidatus Dormibacteraeota bacterium]
MGPRQAAAVGVLCLAPLLSACSGAGPGPTPTPSPTGAVTSPSPAPPGASPSPPPQSALAGCPAHPAAAASLSVLWRAGGADDLATAPGGGLWVSYSASLVAHVVAGAVTRVIRGISVPEGLVALPDGDLVVAEQGRQRILVVHPDGTRTVLLTLPSAGGQLGVDGIGWDPQANRVLVPDSPHGTLLSVPLDQPGHATTLATGLPRVVGVEPAADGDGLYLAAEAEAPRGLLVLSGPGPARPRGDLAQLDDVVLTGGLLYATDLRNGSLDAVDPATGAERTIATGFGEPQGLAVLDDGGLAVADEKRGLVQRIAPCGG